MRVTQLFHVILPFPFHLLIITRSAITSLLIRFYRHQGMKMNKCAAVLAIKIDKIQLVLFRLDSELLEHIVVTVANHFA